MSRPWSWVVGDRHALTQDWRPGKQQCHPVSLARRVPDSCWLIRNLAACSSTPTGTEAGRVLAGVTPEVSQGGAQTYNVEAEQASELAEPSQMTSVAQDQPEASEAAGSGDDDVAEDGEAAEGQPSAEASAAQPDAQEQQGSDAGEADGAGEEQSKAPLLGEEAADAEPSQLSLHSSQAHEQAGQDQGEQDLGEGDEVQAEISEPAAPAAEGSAEPDERAGAEEDDAPAQEASGAAEAEPESEPTMESEVEIPVASLSAASVPAEDSRAGSSLPDKEESSQAAVPADAGQGAAEAEPSATGTSLLVDKLKRMSWAACSH